MSQCRERIERPKNHSLAPMDIICICLIILYRNSTFMTQAYMFKHNADTVRKYVHRGLPPSLPDYIAYLNVLQIYCF